MDQARLEVGLAEGVLDGPMVLAGAFDGDNDIGPVVPLHSLADAVDGRPEGAAVVRQGGRFEEHAAIEVGEEVPGAGLGTVEGDDAEVLGSDGLEAGREEAVGFLQDEALAGPARACGWRPWHGSLLSGKGTVHPQPKRQERGREETFFLSEPPYHGGNGVAGAH